MRPALCFKEELMEEENVKTEGRSSDRRRDNKVGLGDEG